MDVSYDLKTGDAYMPFHCAKCSCERSHRIGVVSGYPSSREPRGRRLFCSECETDQVQRYDLREHRWEASPRA